MRYEMPEFHLYRRLALFGDKHGSWRSGATMYILYKVNGFRWVRRYDFGV